MTPRTVSRGAGCRLHQINDWRALPLHAGATLCVPIVYISQIQTSSPLLLQRQFGRYYLTFYPIFTSNKPTMVDLRKRNAASEAAPPAVKMANPAKSTSSSK